MCVLLNKKEYLQELGKLLIQAQYLSYLDLQPFLQEVEQNIMSGHFCRQEQITPQKTEKDCIKEKIVRAIEVCTNTLPREQNLSLIYMLAILLFKVDYFSYNSIKKDFLKIQKKYVARLQKQN